MLAWMMNLDFAASGSEAPVVEGAAQKPAGRRRRKRYFVEIDRQTFEVDSPEQAISLLAKARALAKEIAPQLVEEPVQKAVSLGKVPQPPVPRIRTNVPQIADAVAQTRDELKVIYSNALVMAELSARLLMELAEEEDEEFLLLM